MAVQKSRTSAQFERELKGLRARLAAAEAALRAARADAGRPPRGQRQFKSLLDNAADVIYRLDLQADRFEYISPSASAALGFSPAEFQAMNAAALLALVHPDDLPLMQAARARLLKEGKTSVEYRQRTRNGDYRWVSNHMSLVRDAAGRRLYNDGSLRDITARKLAETENARLLAEIENRAAELKLLTESIQDSVMAIDRDLRFTYCNKAAEEIAGLSAERILGKTRLELFGDNEASRKTTRFQRKCIETGRPVRYENEIVSRGKRRVFDVRLFPTAAGATIVSREITARKLAEEALLKSRKNLTDTYASMSEGLAQHEVVYDRSGKAVDYVIVDVNPAFEKLTGIKKGTVIGRKATAAYGLKEAPFLAIYSRVAATGEPAAFETYFPPLDKHFNISVFSPRKGEFATIFQDISGRKKKEAEIQKLNRVLRARSASDNAMMRARDEADFLAEVCRIIVEDCGHPMVWIGYAENDEARTVRPVAQAGFEAGYLETLKLTWADTEQGRGPTGTAIRTGKPSGCRNMLDDPAFKPWRAAALARGYASSLVLPLQAGGRTFGALTIYSRETETFTEAETALLCGIAEDLAFGVTAIRLRVENEKAQLILRRDKDTFEMQVKERTRQLLDARVELERARHLTDIGMLAATVAHELRNPLAAISMAASNIGRKAANPLLEKHLHNISKKVLESNQIINNLLFYSRLKAPQYETVDLKAVIGEAVKFAQEKCRGSAVVIKRTEALRNAAVKADPLQVKEVLHNLLNNACDALSARRDGKVVVSAAENGGAVEVRVEDNGPGIDKEHLDRIFNPFFTTKAKGTGLGLYICRQIVNFHNGNIAVKSKPGEGTVVCVTLPSDK